MHILFGGNLTHPCLSAKATQSRYLFFWLQEVLAQRVEVLRGVCATAGALHASAVSLRRIYAEVLSAGPQLERPRYVVDQMLGHLLCLQLAGVVLAPKHHVALEMVLRQYRTGNIRFISEYPDSAV